MSTTASRAKSTVGSRKTARLRASAALGLLVCGLPLAAQKPSPAAWTLSPAVQRAPAGSVITARLNLKLTAPWHMYSLTTPKPGPTGGPTATTIKLAENPAVTKWDVYFPAPKRAFDPNFSIGTETYEGEQSFLLLIELAKDAPAGPLDLEAQMRFQLCTEKECLPPKKVTAGATLEVAAGSPVPPGVIPAGLVRFQPGATPPADNRTAPAAQRQDLGSFLLLAFGFGLAAIFTPCVFPMIPITMSFFLNQGAGGNRRQAVTQAVVFCLGIVVLFTGIGFGLSAALGPFAVVQLGANPWVNGLISVVFLAFGLSLLGAFEITLPTGLLTRLNMASNRGGYLGTLIMGLTFCLAAFACVGPFMGTLLAASVGGDKLQPVLGMLAFSSALASPFFLLALFPSFLGKLPRSGGWMSRVKVVLGFLILAAMLKYLANVDQVMQWGLLTRERYLALWMVLFALPGLYLLGFLRMEGVRREEDVSAGRLLPGVLLLGFALSLAPGMFGTRLGELEAYVPAPAERAAAGGGGLAQARWMKNDFDGALARAKAENRRVLVAFTGYACTNCHWMKANMFPRPEIAAALDEMVLVELYTDGTDAASEENQRRQEKMFQTVAIPFYAVFEPGGSVVASFAGLTRETSEFLKFLQAGKPAA
ncbi:MAG: thioredoxin family protein [Candidatus Solibacter usitatus]|nr:thioredoxin family protein [Candidatus Solibacter usitatus]